MVLTSALPLVLLLVFLVSPSTATTYDHHYYWTWYDNDGGSDWVLVANPASAASDLYFDLAIAGVTQYLDAVPGYAVGQIPPGSTASGRYTGLMGGPVDAASITSDRAITSQRVLWPQGGDSLEEIPGTESNHLSDHFYWTWYDHVSAGYQNWVLVSNPGDTAVWCEITIGGTLRWSGTIAAHDSSAQTFPGVIGGPVEVEAFTDSLHTGPAFVMASQRVLTGNGTAFNEVPGIPASELTSRYLWTWYDQQSAGASDWVLVANENVFSVYYEIRIAGVLKANGTLATGQSATPQFPGAMGGPVEVRAWTDAYKTVPANVIASQRIIWGPSFEEVPGFGTGQASSAFHWTWYDQQSPGVSNWVLVANPNSGTVYYEISTAGTVRASGSIYSGHNVAPQFNGIMEGPVEVRAWTDSSKGTPAAVMASQRVLWKGHFNEVIGMPETPVAVDFPLVNATNPTTPVKLIFIHHSTGENWISDGNGNLGSSLTASNYFVSDTNYGWGPADLDVGADTIGDHTDIGHWYNWFAGPNAATYLTPLYAESGQHSTYTRMGSDPGGSNQIIMFKSCFPNSALEGNPGDPPTTGANPLRGQDAGSGNLTVANAKGIYNDILPYFAAHQEKLFVVITAPPLGSFDTNVSQAANARAFNLWLTQDWLLDYPYNNVAVFDFYNVLTTNGGNVNTNDLESVGGNHHRYLLGSIEYIYNQGGNYSAYAAGGDSHPTTAGSQKATGEFVQWLNVAYHRWQGA